MLLKEATQKFEVLILIEVEYVMNSRRTTYVSNKPEDVANLIPKSCRIGSSSTLKK